MLGASTDPMTVTPLQLIGARRTIQGWPSGTARDSEDALNFCALTGIRHACGDIPAGTGSGSLRPDAERKGSLSCCVDHGVTLSCSRLEWVLVVGLLTIWPEVFHYCATEVHPTR